MPLPAEPFKVFISHATFPDSALANWMADALDRLHFRAFVYERYYMGGQNRFETIKGRIRDCPYFLVLLTGAGISSQWVNQEIGYAVAVGKEPIPVTEVDLVTNTPMKTSGFVELHDSIPYYRGQTSVLMASVLYTLVTLSGAQKAWRDTMSLSCKCGNDFDGTLEFVKHWHMWLSTNKPFPIWWTCQKCQQPVTISFPDCHLVPQTT